MPNQNYSNPNQNQRHTGSERPNPNNAVNLNKFIIPSFLTDKGLVDLKLITDIGDGNVKELADFLHGGRDKPDKININQLRKFYDDFLNIYDNNLPFEQKKIQLIMLKAHAEYSAKRLNCNNFKKIFQNRIDILVKIEDKEEFLKNLDAFKLHFEALVGYFPKN